MNAEDRGRIIALQQQHIRRLESLIEELAEANRSTHASLTTMHAAIRRAHTLAQRSKRREMLEIVAALAAVELPPLPEIDLVRAPEPPRLR